jgi:predicted transposase YbfD/YdcC
LASPPTNRDHRGHASLFSLGCEGYVSRIELTAERFGHAVRAHWGIENRAHHVRDRILGEDASRIRCQPGIFPGSARSRSISCAPTVSPT